MLVKLRDDANHVISHYSSRGCELPDAWIVEASFVRTSLFLAVMISPPHATCNLCYDFSVCQHITASPGGVSAHVLKTLPNGGIKIVNYLRQHIIVINSC